MKYLFALAGLWFLQLLETARATALTTALAANERLCFYADVDKAGEKLGVRFASSSTTPSRTHNTYQFYFAVRPSSHLSPTFHSNLFT